MHNDYDPAELAQARTDTAKLRHLLHTLHEDYTTTSSPELVTADNLNGLNDHLKKITSALAHLDYYGPELLAAAYTPALRAVA